MKWMKKLAIAFSLLAVFAQATYAADVSITAANVVHDINATYATGIAGATITAGQPLYLDSGTNTLKLCDANASQAAASCVGISLHGAASGQPIKYQTGGDITIGGTLTVGGVYVCSGTAGSVAPVADLATGWYTTVILIGRTASIGTIVLAQPSTLVAVP